ncbi:MAG: hypothetical protein ACRDN8_18810 [Thermoleophilaceae bacterium]
MADSQLSSELGTELSRINTGIGRYIAKGVTFVLTPILLPLATSFAYGLQKWFGLGLDPAALTGYLTAVAGGIAITGYKWVANRGEWERTVYQLAEWHNVGQAAQAAGQAPPPQPQ